MKNEQITDGNPRKFKVRIYDDNRITLHNHDYNPFQNRTHFIATPIIPKDKYADKSFFMSTKAYVRLLKATHAKLWKKKFEQDKCFFITLTLENSISISKLNNEFKRFMIYMTRHFGLIEYLRAIELLKDCKRYHIHAIIQFQNFPISLDSKIIENLWKIGKCEVKKSYDIWGALQYVTKYKEHHIQNENKYYTYFPARAKLITTSQHFGKDIDINQYRELYITEEEKNLILHYHINEHNRGKGKGKFIKIDGHYYNDTIKGIKRYCVDKVYIRSTKSFIKVLEKKIHLPENTNTLSCF